MNLTDEETLIVWEFEALPMNEDKILSMKRHIEFELLIGDRRIFDELPETEEKKEIVKVFMADDDFEFANSKFHVKILAYMEKVGFNHKFKAIYNEL